MANEFYKEGEMVDYTPGADVAAGDVIDRGSRFGIALEPIASGVLGALAVCGIFKIAKSGSSGPTFSVGDRVYWDATNSLADSTAAGNKVLGIATAAAGASDTYVYVALNATGMQRGVTAAGVASVTGTGSVTTGLATVTSAIGCLAEDSAVTGTTVTVSIPTQTGSNAGKFTLEVWKPTATNDVTPIAATGAKSVAWVAFGT